MTTLKNKILDRLSIDGLPTETTLKAAMKSLIPTYLPELTDLNASSNIVRLTDLVAVFMARFMLDLTIDIANESMLATASQYEWVAQRARDLGYTPSPGSGSTVTLTLTRLTASAVPTTVLREDFVFYTRKGLNSPRVRFEMPAASVTVPAGGVGTSVTFSAAQGERITGEVLGTCDGTSFQRLQSTRYRSFPGYEVLVIDGDTWSKATNNNLLEHTALEQVYELYYSEEGNAIFQFGDGTYGAKPSGSAILEQRIIPDDIDGNVAASTIIDTSPSSSILRVSNVSAATGWEAPESVDSIRFQGSRAIRVNTDCCSPENIEANVEANFTYVGRCYTIPGDRGENTIGVYVCGTDGSDLTTVQLTAIKNWIDDRNPGTEFVFVSNIETTNVNVYGTLYVQSGYSTTEVQAAVEAAVAEYFSPTGVDSAGNRTLDPGGILYRALIEHVIMGVAGVHHVTFIAPGTESTITDNALPELDLDLTYSEV